MKGLSLRVRLYDLCPHVQIHPGLSREIYSLYLSGVSPGICTLSGKEGQRKGIERLPFCMQFFEITHNLIKFWRIQ